MFEEFDDYLSTMTEGQKNEIENLMREKFREYLNSYTSTVPLSEDWKKRKGNSEFYRNRGYSYYELSIQYAFFPMDSWEDYDVIANQKFKYASYQRVPSQNAVRHFLPTAEPAFDNSGNPTYAMRRFVNGLLLEVLQEFDFD